MSERRGAEWGAPRSHGANCEGNDCAGAGCVIWAVNVIAGALLFLTFIWDGVPPNLTLL